MKIEPKENKKSEQFICLVVCFGRQPEAKVILWHLAHVFPEVFMDSFTFQNNLSIFISGVVFVTFCFCFIYYSTCIIFGLLFVAISYYFLTSFIYFWFTFPLSHIGHVSLVSNPLVYRSVMSSLYS